MAFSVFLVLITLVCLLLMIVIMVQNPKGGGLSSSIGGGNQMLGGYQKTTDFLDKSTWTLGIVLILLILFSSMSFNSGSSSLIIDENAKPAQTQEMTPAEQPAKDAAKPADGETK